MHRFVPRTFGFRFATAVTCCLFVFGAAFTRSVVAHADQTKNPALKAATEHAEDLVAQGQNVFRFDTFGDEAFWGDTLQLHKAIAGAANGGVGGGVSPATALAVGLKVDLDALPPAVVNAVAAGKVNLNDPAVTVLLLQLNSVVGVKGVFDASGKLTSMGVTCALCHSSVDDASGIHGIGHRLDGWPNRDLNVGAIVSLAPNLQPVATLLSNGTPGAVTVDAVKSVLATWGPGKYDAEIFLDGKAFNPQPMDNGVVLPARSAATLIPAAFGLAGVNLHTYTGWGSVPYWNAFVANLEMHGIGNFNDNRLDNADKFPIAATFKFGHTHNDVDLITSKLPALQAYQLSLAAPKAPAGSFDPAAAKRGEAVFNGEGKCATCHMQPTLTDSGWNAHTADEIGIESFQADRSPDGVYRTTPLRGLSAARSQGGYYHDGRFQTLAQVVEHYNQLLLSQGNPGLTAQQKADLVQYLKSL